MKHDNSITHPADPAQLVLQPLHQQPLISHVEQTSAAANPQVPTHNRLHPADQAQLVPTALLKPVHKQQQHVNL
jgi:hypothetical protein